MTTPRTRRLPVVTAMLDDAMRAWLERGAPDEVGRKAEGVAQTDAEIELIMAAISASVEFRVIQCKMEWDTLKRAWRAMAQKWREVGR